MKKKLGHQKNIPDRPDRIKSHQADPVAHPSHHTANQEHGTPQGFAPPSGYQDGSGFDPHMGDNECCNE